MKFKTINPATENIIEEYEYMSADAVFSAAEGCNAAFSKWKKSDISERSVFITKLAGVLRENKNKYAAAITTEMGKPIGQSIAEVEKCAWAAEVYAENAAQWLEEETVQADGKRHIVTYEPLGTILSIMPWNFPLWQAFRFAIPTLLAGNTSVLKHSDVVTQSALIIEEAFKDAGLPDGVFKTVITDHKTIGGLLQSELIQGVSLTGSTGAGEKVGEIAGRGIKKCVLELGGSDPFIVLDDCNIEFTAKNAVTGRMQNSGQSCIAAKRFIVVEKVADAFSQQFAKLAAEQVVGDPLDINTDIGPLVSRKQREQIEEQVKDAVDKGAAILTGGERLNSKGFFYKPTVLGNIDQKMKVACEEVFGPVAPIMVVKDENEAVSVANNTEFGLGASIWTGDEKKGLELAKQIEAGDVFINSIVKSDPRMPFGGIKKSGIGRELSKFGLKEFVNIKGINVYSNG